MFVRFLACVYVCIRVCECTLARVRVYRSTSGSSWRSRGRRSGCRGSSSRRGRTWCPSSSSSNKTRAPATRSYTTTRTRSAPTTSPPGPRRYDRPPPHPPPPPPVTRTGAPSPNLFGPVKLRPGGTEVAILAHTAQDTFILPCSFFKHFCQTNFCSLKHPILRLPRHNHKSRRRMPQVLFNWFGHEHSRWVAARLFLTDRIVFETFLSWLTVNFVSFSIRSPWTAGAARMNCGASGFFGFWEFGC